MLDEQGVAEALRRKETAEGWIAWLRDMRWEYFAHGTTADPVTGSTMLRLVTNWLAPYPNVYAAVGVQRGPALFKYHIHILIGGIPRTKLMESALRGSFIKRGHMQIDGYRHGQGGVEYLVRQSDEIELIGEPKLFAAAR